MSKYGEVSKPGRAWMEAALDPFHDYQLEHVAGFPDILNVPSVTQMVTKNLTVSKPAGMAAGNWTAAIFYTGLTGQGAPGTMRTTASSMAGSSATPQTDSSMSPLIITSCLGSTAAILPDINQADLYRVQTLDDSIQGDDSPYRVLSVGFEVHNTTAKMYQQGSMTAGILAPWARDAGMIPYADTAATAPAPTTFMQSDLLSNVPSTESSLRLVPSARTWEAAKGVYMVSRVNTVPAIGKRQEGRDEVIYFTDGGLILHTGIKDKASIPGSTGTFLRAVGPTVSGFSPMMALFTGLSDQTTLTVTMRTLVEIFPTNNSVLLPLATPSCIYDPDALKAYSAISELAPYAVPVSSNASGDFFRAVVMAAQTAAPLFGLIPKVGQFIHGGINTVAPLINGYLDSRERKKREQASQKSGGSRKPMVHSANMGNTPIAR